MFGLKSGYLDTFLKSLTDNGVPDLRRIECPIHKHTPAVLQSVRTMTPSVHDFQVSVLGAAWLASVNRVKVSLTASIATSRLKDGTVTALQGVMGQDITPEFKHWAVLFDRDAVYRDLTEWKRSQRWWNLAFDAQAIDSALASSKFEIYGFPGMLTVREATDLVRINRLASTVVRRLFESAYRKQENRKSRYALIAACESGIPDQYFKEFHHVQP